jgi:protein transport protein SEC9
MKKLSKKLSSSAAPSEDPNRSALFGSRRSSQSDQPSNIDNPYARQDPYASQSSEPYPQRQDPHTRSPPVSRNHQSPASPQLQQNPSAVSRGYLNGSAAEDSARNALFENRPPPTQRDPYTNGYYDHSFNEPDLYQEYQQQAEEDDEDIEAIKQEIKFVKQDSLASTRNAIRIGLEAEEQGRHSLARLGTQSEKLSSVDRNLDVSAAHARFAEEKARELKRLNRSMFAIHVSNPFTAKSRAEKEEREIIVRHELERLEREKNRREAYESAQRVNNALKAGTARTETGKGRSTITSRSPYSFEEDEEDVQIEKDIDANLNTLGGITSRLKGLALATQAEIEGQNERLDSIANKVWPSLKLRIRH